MEVLIVVCIIGILSSLALPNLLSAIYKGRAAKIVEDLRVIRDAVTTFHLDTNTWPRSRGYGLIRKELLPYLPAGVSFDLSSWDTDYAVTNYSNKDQAWKDTRGYSVILRARINNVRLANAVKLLAPNLFDSISLNKKRGIFYLYLE